MTRYRNIVWTGPLVVALLAGCSGQTATTQGSTDAQSAASWPGPPLITPTGKKAEFQGSDLLWTADHRLTGGGSTLTIDGDDWEFYTDGVAC